MTSKKLYLLLVGIITLLGVGIIGGAYGANALFQNQSKQLVKQKAISKALADQQHQLVRDKRDIKEYAELNSIAKTIVPQDKDQAQTIREILKIAHDSGIPRLTSISFPPSTLGGALAAPTVAGSTATPKTSGNANLTQLTPVKGISGVYNLRITIQQQRNDAVTYNTFITFLHNLEQNRRTAQVSNITITPDNKDPNVITFTLIIDEYLKP
jgi:hypothetical protein